MKNPEFKIFTGPMFGGKTTKLLAALERYRYQRKDTVLFKPYVDKRYSKGMVVTHHGQNCKSILVKSGEGIIENSGLAEIIAVDEMFMIPGSSEALLKLFSQGKTILVSTLQLSSQPAPLQEVKDILPYATSIEICPAVCSMCDADAFYTRRKGASTALVEVGGCESYEPLCFYHYSKIVGIT